MSPVMVRNILQDVGICSYVQFIGQRSPHLVLSLSFDWVFSYGWPEMSWDYAAPCTRARIVYCLMHWVYLDLKFGIWYDPDGVSTSYDKCVGHGYYMDELLY